MTEGIVKFFNEEKGFGFIIETDTQKEFFVHVSNLINEIRKNDIVTFEIKQDKRGPVAVDVKVVR